MDAAARDPVASRPAGGAFRAGDKVLLIDVRNRRYMITLDSGKQFHSHLGALPHETVIGAPEGSEVTTTGGSRLLAFRPTLADFIVKMRRGAQVVYPKDIGLILVYADIFPGATVVEAGTGSGALTLALARATGSTGKVVSYEVRGDHRDQAATNIRQWHGTGSALPDNVELRGGDIFAEVPEFTADRMVLDLPEPWHAVDGLTAILSPGGILCCYLPTVPQVARTVEAARAAGFSLLSTIEGLVRSWNVDGQSVRPDHRMVAHTGFIVTARKRAHF